MPSLQVMLHLDSSCFLPVVISLAPQHSPPYLEEEVVSRRASSAGKGRTHSTPEYLYPAVFASAWQFSTVQVVLPRPFRRVREATSSV